nr:N-acetylmuramoyl-L-alanine amidase [Nocardioides flavescens]
MLGFTWAAPRGSAAQQAQREPAIWVRLRTRRGWGLWRPVPLLQDGPDPAAEGRGRRGTSPLLIDPVDGLQVRVGRHLPRDISLTLLHSEPTLADSRVVAARRAPIVPPQAGRTEAAPPILSRAQWQADESWRSGSPTYDTTIVQAHIHHTATSNGYAASAVPAMIRSMYKYHTKSLGWSDIGYNFLVDQYGAIWEGRYGGVDQVVRGAHTLGFNNDSTGFSMIGNFETTAPTPALLSSVSALAGWKLGLYGRDPNGIASVVSTGSDKFPRGRTVSLPVIDGHRDTNDTACPGTNVYNALPQIRAGAAGTIAAATIKLKKDYAISGTPVVGSVLTADGGKFKPAETAVTFQWTRAGVAIDGAVAQTYQLTEADIGQVVGCVVSGSLPGSAAVQQGVSISGGVASVPTLAVRTQRKPGGKAIIHVEVTAPGVALPDGTMTVRVGKGSRTVTLKKGKAVARFVGLKPGRYRVRCQYAGGTFVVAGKKRDWVRIPG